MVALTAMPLAAKPAMVQTRVVRAAKAQRVVVCASSNKTFVQVRCKSFRGCLIAFQSSQSCSDSFKITAGIGTFWGLLTYKFAINVSTCRMRS